MGRPIHASSNTPVSAGRIARDVPAEPRGKPVRRGLHERVVSEIGMQIVSGALPPDSILLEGDLASDFGISRNGIREAIKVLAAKGLAASRPKVGTVIMPRSRWNLLDPDILWWWSRCPDISGFAVAVTEVRRIIEPKVAALAAQRSTKSQTARIRRAYEGMEQNLDQVNKAIEHDRDFHEAIMEASANDVLRSVGALIETALIASFNLTIESSSNALARTLPNHKQVLLAIEARDGAGAERAMLDLLDETWKILSKAVHRDGRRGRSAPAARATGSGSRG